MSVLRLDRHWHCTNSDCWPQWPPCSVTTIWDQMAHLVRSAQSVRVSVTLLCIPTIWPGKSHLIWFLPTCSVSVQFHSGLPCFAYLHTLEGGHRHTLHTPSSFHVQCWGCKTGSCIYQAGKHSTLSYQLPSLDPHTSPRICSSNPVLRFYLFVL